MTADIEDQVLQDLYAWVDLIPLSRPKKHMARDFSDGVLMAEIVKYHFPKLVELYNFPAAHGTVLKKKNWQLLNSKVFKRLNFQLSDDVIESIVTSKPGTIERVLLLLRAKIDRNVLTDRSAAAAAVFASESKLPEPNTGLSSQSIISLDLPLQTVRSTAVYNGIDFVPRLAYEEKVQELLAKEETIKILNSKVTKLDHLLRLKDIRIDELQRTLGSSLHTHGASGDSPRTSRQYSTQQQYPPPSQLGSVPVAYYNVAQQTERR